MNPYSTIYYVHTHIVLSHATRTESVKVNKIKLVLKVKPHIETQTNGDRNETLIKAIATKSSTQCSISVIRYDITYFYKSLITVVDRNWVQLIHITPSLNKIDVLRNEYKPFDG